MVELFVETIAGEIRWPTRGTTRGRCKPTSAPRNIQHTGRYTELAPARFKEF